MAFVRCSTPHCIIFQLEILSLTISAMVLCLLIYEHSICWDKAVRPPEFQDNQSSFCRDVYLQGHTDYGQYRLLFWQNMGLQHMITFVNCVCTVNTTD